MGTSPSLSPAGDAFHEHIKNLVLVGWSWALAVVAAWWAASQWRGRAKTRELLAEQSAPDEEIVAALSFFHAEPLSLVFFICTVAAAGVLQKLSLIPLTTIGLALVGAPGWPWLTTQLVASLWAVADLVDGASFVCLLPVAFFYCETDSTAGISGRLRDASKSLALLCEFRLWVFRARDFCSRRASNLSAFPSDGLLGSLLFAIGRLLSIDLWSAGSLIAGIVDLPFYFFCLLAAPKGAEKGFRRARDAWIPLDLKNQLKMRNEAIEIERQFLRTRLETLSRTPAAEPRKVSGNFRLAKANSLLEVETPDLNGDPLQRRTRSLSAQRSTSRSREAVHKYARHVSINGLLSPGAHRFALPRTPSSDSPLDQESIEKEIEALDFEEMVNLNTMKVPFVAWNIGCAIVFGSLLVGWILLSLHTLQGLVEWLGVYPSVLDHFILPPGQVRTAVLTLSGAIAQSYLIVTAVAGFYALPLFSALRNNRASFPHLILGLVLLSGTALALPRIASDIHVFRVAGGYVRMGGWAGRLFAALFLARLVGMGRPRLG